MEHDWQLSEEGSDAHLVCSKCGLAPRYYGAYGGGLTVRRDDLSPGTRCFGSQELTADIVRRALQETGFTLYYLPKNAIPWQELLGGIAVKDSGYDIIERPDMVALWLGDNGDMIAYGNDTVTLTHPSTHQLTAGADLSPGYDHDCDAKTLPRNPRQNTGWGQGLLVWIAVPRSDD